MSRIGHTEAAHRRILIVGVSCAGKSTLGLQLSKRLQIPLIELDSLAFEAGWKRVSDGELERRIGTELTNHESWVIVGNYTEATRNSAWPLATMIVWIDLPIYLSIYRILRRASLRWWRNEVVLPGCKESPFHVLFGRSSLVRYTLRTYRARRKRFALEMDGRWIRLRRSSDIKAFALSLQS